MRADIVLADEAIPDDQQYGTGGVEEGIETRKISNVEHDLVKERVGATGRSPLQVVRDRGEGQQGSSPRFYRACS